MVLAVMDGCTMGKESAFAAMLMGKTLRKICKELFYQDLKNAFSCNLEDLAKKILEELFQELKNQKNRLTLETEELLSTLIISVVHTRNQEAFCIVVGDGLIYYDGTAQEYEQNNTPDYLGYHLHKNFEDWYTAQHQKLFIPHFQNLSISTDGIFSFQKQKNALLEKKEADFIDFLFLGNEDFDKPHFFEKKLRHIHQQWLYDLTDDLAAIRLNYPSSLLS